MVQITKYWIEGVLTEAFPRFERDKGVDLNKDGRIAGAEVFGDLNRNGTVGDREDYKLYLANNRSALSSAVPFFKWGERLSVGNRIHQLMYLESDLHPHSAAWVESAYTLIADMAKDVGRAKKAAQQDGRELTNIEEATLYYRTMSAQGFAFPDIQLMDDPSFVGNIHDRVLDCDGSSYLAMAVGDELGLELNLVLSPEHVFLRGWDEDGRVFNVDRGVQTIDDFYITTTDDYFTTDYEWNADPDTVSRGIYLQTLDEQGTEAQSVFIRGIVLGESGRCEEALAAYDHAIALDPKMAAAHFNRGVVLEELGRHEEALAAYDRAMALDPKMAAAHCARGAVLGELGRHEEALAAYDRAMALDPKKVGAHYNRGVALENLGRYEEALAAFDRAIALDPKMANAHYNRGVALEKLGRFAEALFAYGMAAIWDSK